MEQAALAIKWIMAHPRSDEGIEKEGSQLQHMVKVLRSLLQSVIPTAQPPRPAAPPAHMANRVQTGATGAHNTFSVVPSKPLGQLAGTTPSTTPGVSALQSTTPGFVRPGQPLPATTFPAPIGQAARPISAGPAQVGQSHFAVRPVGLSGSTMPAPPNTQSVVNQPLGTIPAQQHQPQAVIGVTTPPGQGQFVSSHALQANSNRSGTASLARSPVPSLVDSTVPGTPVPQNVPPSMMTTTSNTNATIKGLPGTAVDTLAISGATDEPTNIATRPVARESPITVSSDNKAVPTTLTAQHSSRQRAAVETNISTSLPQKVSPNPATALVDDSGHSAVPSPSLSKLPVPALAPPALPSQSSTSQAQPSQS